jgi:muconolactone delta-isomerase
MQFLSISRRLTERFTDADFAALVADEQEQARRLYADGVIRQIWHRADVGGACILVEADSEAHARERLNSLPMFSRGMLDVTIIPLKPYAGFGPRAPK